MRILHRIIPPVTHTMKVLPLEWDYPRPVTHSAFPGLEDPGQSLPVIRIA